jgi:hypothetical protein
MKLQEILNNANDTLQTHKDKIASLEAGGIWRGSFETAEDIPPNLTAKPELMTDDEWDLFRKLDVNDLITIQKTDDGKERPAIWRYTAQINKQKTNYDPANFKFSHFTAADLSGLEEDIDEIKNTLENGVQKPSEELSFGDADGEWQPVKGFGVQALKDKLAEDSDDNDLMYEWELIAT